MSRLPVLPVVAAGLLLLTPVLAPAPLSAQDPLFPHHEAIAFLVGGWRTSSTFPDGRVGKGDLRFRWVLGGAWMYVEFVGEHPDGVLWEAQVMQRWDPEAGAYEAWTFTADGPPVRRRGTVLDPGHYRLEHTSNDGITAGIDYHRQHDGTVYQENWVVEPGDERRVTLRTTYRPETSDATPP